ncbi:MAG: DEAD/DEAH box helicase [Chloroflexi bacterium]|nr:DEAD/DEAH box helicase [Chloroflexota bacterium]
MPDLASILARLSRDPDLGPNFTHWEVSPAREPAYAPWPPALDQRLARMLAARGISQLYSHQAAAAQRALQGLDVVVVTPTASGKTLCYNLPVLHGLLHEPEQRALYLFPTKALGHDQLASLQASLDALGLPGAAASYDGDTPSAKRATIRRTARILLTNPDMLHLGILPYHTQWQPYLSRLRWVIIDEIHHYRGIFGSHVANVARRLERICAFYGSHPRFICCSATIANPAALAEKLIGRPVEVVAESGAPQGKRTFCFYNPPIVNPELGLRRAAQFEVRAIANRLLDGGVQTAVFARTRLTTELLLTYLREDAARRQRDPERIQGYRGGYLPLERRKIESDLRGGVTQAVVATSALELGVDIGSLEAVVLAGYPGTIASTWQQAGRAGRGRAESAAFLVATAAPLDQYIVSHPEYFFGRSPEHALVNPNNSYLLLEHLRCAAYELPFGDGETYGGRSVDAELSALAETGQVRHDRGRWYWAANQYPAQDISLRTADGQQITIEAVEPDGQRRTIGQIDRASALQLVHVGAIYMHGAEQYLVDVLDLEGAVALVHAVQVDYYTDASTSTQIHIERSDATYGGPGAAHPNLQLTLGEVTVTWRVTGYKRLRLGNMENLGWVDLSLPEQQMLTQACWLTVPTELVERLCAEGNWVGESQTSRGPSWPEQRDQARYRDGYRCQACGAPERPGKQHDVHHLVPFREFGWVAGLNENHRQANALANLVTLCHDCHRQAEQRVAVMSTLLGLSRVLGQIVPLYLMCDPGDLLLHSDVQAPQTGLPTIFVIDGVPGGIGLSEALPELFPAVLERASELVRACPCGAGCPSCIGPLGGDDQAKQRVIALSRALLQAAPLE